MASLNVKVHLSIMSIVQLDFVKVYQYLALQTGHGPGLRHRKRQLRQS